jgi:hypothetical protein
MMTNYSEKIQALIAERDAAIREAHDNKQRARAFQRDAERYRMLRDNGYLDHLFGDLHPCNEPRRAELTDSQVDRYAAIHASGAVSAA